MQSDDAQDPHDNVVLSVSGVVTPFYRDEQLKLRAIL